MTKGEYRVGITFNPSNDDIVSQIKRQAADLIDLIETIPVPKVDSVDTAFYSNEVARLKALAMTDIEGAAMWGVKAATKQAPEGTSE